MEGQHFQTRWFLTWALVLPQGHFQFLWWANNLFKRALRNGGDSSVSYIFVIWFVLDRTIFTLNFGEKNRVTKLVVFPSTYLVEKTLMRSNNFTQNENYIRRCENSSCKTYARATIVFNFGARPKQYKYLNNTYAPYQEFSGIPLTDYYTKTFVLIPTLNKLVTLTYRKKKTKHFQYSLKSHYHSSFIQIPNPGALKWTGVGIYSLLKKMSTG